MKIILPTEMRQVVVIKDIPEEVMLAENSTLKQLLEIVHDVKSTKDKVLEADPNLEMSITIWQHVTKMFHIIHYTMR